MTGIAAAATDAGRARIVTTVREAVVDAADVHDLIERVDVISQVTEAHGIRVRFIVADGSEEVGEDVAPSLEDAYLYLLRTAEEPA